MLKASETDNNEMQGHSQQLAQTRCNANMQQRSQKEVGLAMLAVFYTLPRVIVFSSENFYHL